MAAATLVKDNLVKPIFDECKGYPNWQRAVKVASAPVYCVTAIVDVALGAVALFGTAVTFGKFEALSEFAGNGLAESKKIANKPFRIFLKQINPNWKIQEGDPIIIIKRKGNIHSCDGFTSDWVTNSPLPHFAQSQTHSNAWMERHITSRLACGLLAVAYLVTRVVDGLIALPAAPLALLTGGKFASLNNLADRTTQAPCVIYDLFWYITRVINPEGP